MNPSRRASAVASSTSRDLPTPASPPISISVPLPERARSTACSRRVRSWARPTNGVRSCPASTPLASSVAHGTSQRFQGASIPLRANSPRSSRSARAVPSTPRTVSEARIPPAGATDSMRLAMISVSPCRPPSSFSTSPVCTPMRSCTATSGRWRLRRATARWISWAQATARRADWKAAISPSPVSLREKPCCLSTSASARATSSRSTAVAAASPRR